MFNRFILVFLFFFGTSISSVVCNVQSCPLGPETTSSLPGLACPGWRDRPGLVVPSSPFPLLTGLALLLETITGIHKGLSCKVALMEDCLDFSGGLFKISFGFLHSAKMYFAAILW